jgi:hypothetical protein
MNDQQKILTGILFVIWTGLLLCGKQEYHKEFLRELKEIESRNKFRVLYWLLFYPKKSIDFFGTTYL